MKSILFICPYFGKLPKEQFKLWLRSCEYNNTINWMIITDDQTFYKKPNNVEFKYISFIEFKKFIQNKFDFPISLETPYKLCDYKPIYGYIFEEQIKGFDFWGYCDISDCIFGNLRLFLIDSILEENDKILFLGHLTLFRNIKAVNERFLIQTKSGISLPEIIGVKDNCAFDELKKYSINQIYLENNFKMCRLDELYADVSPLRYSFQLSCYDINYSQYYSKAIPRVFEWKDGILFDCYVEKDEVKKRELGYVHFQKRSMKNEISHNHNHYLIVPNGFVSAVGDLTVEQIIKYSANKVFYLQFFKLKYAALRYRLRKLIKWKKSV